MKHKFGHRFNFFLERDDYRKVQEIARSEGMSLATWIRVLIRKTLKRRQD